MSLAKLEDRSGPAPSSLIDLHNRLDTLWAAYLHNLDQYAAAQKTIQQHMSAGFLSLARANFNARNGARRYGKDFFHERAIASKRVEISADDDDELTKLALIRWEADVASDDASLGQTSKEENASPRTKTESTKQQQPSPPTTPEAPEIENDKAGEDTRHLEPPQTTHSNPLDASKADPASTSSKPNPSLDPLRWFGILVPPDLRAAQASSTSAVDGSVADAVNAARQMRVLETEIRRLRKGLRRAEKVGSG